MNTPILRLNGIDGHTLLKVLDGISEPVGIKLVIELPTEAGHELNYIRIYGNHNSVKRLGLMVATLAEMKDLDLPIFSLWLSAYVDHKHVADDIQEITAPAIDRAKWKEMSRMDRQQLLLKTVQTQTLCSLAELSSMLEVARSHVSNAMNGKRGLGWVAFTKLIERFPLSTDMKDMVKETMLMDRNPKKR
jgi:hypothetical protein